MLGVLHIENVAVIASAEITFREGLNVLTGETGAGKSIIIDSVNALLGERTSRDIIRTGEKSALVSGVFFDAGAAAEAVLREQGIDPEEDGSIVLTRKVTADGRNLCKINGKTVPLSALKALAPCLVQIHGQHDSKNLLNPDTHLALLDRYAGTQDLLAEYKALLASLKEMAAHRKALTINELEKQRKIDLLQFRINEIEAANPKIGEDEALTSARNTARDAAALVSALQAASAALSGSGSESGAVTLTETAARGLKNAAKNPDKEYRALCDRLYDLSYQLSDCASEISRLRGVYEYSEYNLDDIEGRLSVLSALKRKYGGSIESVLKAAQDARAELEAISKTEEELSRIAEQYGRLYDKTMEAARRLSKLRREKASELERAVVGELEYLCMPGARFEAAFEQKEKNGRIVFGADGIDNVEFLISANRGEDLKPLAKTASGGELSRVMLALDNIFACGCGTLVFDEIDSGLSGIAASRVAERLYRLAKGSQVLCVTHLSQLAAMADTHFLISKSSDGRRTYTGVAELDADGRAAELARINGGEHPTDEMLAAARAQLEAAALKKR